jgi:hypothetical protein
MLRAAGSGQWGGASPPGPASQEAPPLPGMPMPGRPGGGGWGGGGGGGAGLAGRMAVLHPAAVRGSVRDAWCVAGASVFGRRRG